MKLSCAILVRDDASTLRACLESVRPHVDELIIVDTGSTDESVAIGKEFADRWELFLGCNSPDGLIEDFAMARNHSFSLATGDWICWFDADDYVRGGEHLRRLAADASHPNTHYLFPYEYARDAAGNVTTLQIRERLMRPPHAQVWTSPVHEYCTSTEPDNASIIVQDAVVVEHRSHLSQKQREPGRNLRILEKYVNRIDEKHDTRALYYAGVEYQSNGNHAQALRYLRRYVELADWADEKCRAMLSIAEYYLRGGDYKMAIEWANQARLVKSWPEPWFVMGRAFYAMANNLKQEPDRNYHKAIYHFMKGLDHPTDVILFANPQDRFEVHVLLNVCFHAVGDNERAMWSCEEGLKGLPGHPMLLNNLGEYRKGKRRGAVLHAVQELEQAGDIDGMQAAFIRETLSGRIRVETEEGRGGGSGGALPPARLEPQPADPGKLDVVLFLGPGLERWTPETWERTGMGGSETMAWQMARRLRALGHRVRFFTDCSSGQEGVYEGVEWLSWQRFRGIECDVLIASRMPWAVDDEVTVSYEGKQATIGGCKALARLLWVHDVHAGDQLNLKRLQRIDRILCLSEWHKRTFRQCYANPGTGVSVIPESKVVVTRNGIDLARFEGEERRVQHRAVYSSSPDRGLKALVELWPRVRLQVPDAELHVFYGWANWEKSAVGDPAQLAAISHLKQLARTTPGVVMRDRVGQRELAREFMRAGVWAYPTWFVETSCITAMEAQAAGLWVVTSALAALGETVSDRGVLLDWVSDSRDPTPEYRDKFVDAVVEAMRREARPPLVAEYARSHFGLDELAAEWEAMLLQLVAELRENPVPAFDGKAAE